jgi:hypothetical protein
MPFQYAQGATIPDAGVSWLDANGNVINFNAYNLTAQLSGRAPNGALVTASVFNNPQPNGTTLPNVTVYWSATDLGSLLPGVYTLEIKANRAIDGKNRIYQDTVNVTGAVY